MERRIRLALLACVAVLSVPPWPAFAQPLPKTPDDYPFDPPEFRLLFEATYFTETMHNLTRQGLYAEAEPHARRALERMSMLSEQELPTAVCRMNLADVCLRLGKLPEAEHHYRLCLQTFSGPRANVKGALGDNEPVGLCLNKLAMVCQGMGRMQEAEQLCERGLAVVEARRGRYHPQIAVGLTSLAEICRETGRFQLAEQHLRMCVRIRESRLGKDHLDTASSLGNLGSLYLFLRKLDEAEPLLHHCLRIREQKLGPKHLDVAAALNNLAELSQLTGRFQQAAAMNRGALEIREARLGPNHPDVATSLENLAAAHQALGMPSEELLQRSRLIRDSASLQRKRGVD